MLDQSQRTLAIELLSFNGYSIEAERLIRLDKTLWDDDQLWENVFRTSSYCYNDDNSGTWLTRAAANGDYRTVERLVAINKNIQNEDADIIPLKLQNHQDMNAKGPLYWALRSNSISTFELLKKDIMFLEFDDIDDVIYRCLEYINDTTLLYLMYSKQITYEKHRNYISRVKQNGWSVLHALSNRWNDYSNGVITWGEPWIRVAKELGIRPEDYIYHYRRISDEDQAFVKNHLEAFYPDKKNAECYKCGRKGHHYMDCNCERHVDGGPRYYMS